MAGPMRSSLWCRGSQGLASLSFGQLGRGGSSNEGEAASHLPEFNYCPCLPRPRPLTHQIFIFFISMEGFHIRGLPYCEEH